MLNFCPYCGSKILNQGVRFCVNCGKPLAAFMGAENPSETPALEQELAKCRKSAEEGFRLAKDNCDEIKSTLLEEERRLGDANAQQNRFTRIKSGTLIERQRAELKRLSDSIKLIRKDIQALHERAKDFSIVVYGRTMAGKSMLMEILTRGNGESIGKGAQRITLDVRHYFWNGLKITDVPGISAFGGAQDERLALEAAKSADLILFLLTDDAPQADEAEKLAQLKKFGKPILGLINVKIAFDMTRRALSLKKLQKRLADTAALDAILNQFKQHGQRYNQDWSGIQFVATHLLAAYQSHPCRGNDAEVFSASQFAQVENFILDKVRNDGRFLRIKTFADSISVPVSNIILKIHEHSGNALIESQIWLDKRNQMLAWREDFVKRVQRRINGLYEELSGILKREIETFAAHHYEDEKINETWPARIKELGFDTRYENLLKEMAAECERKRKELSDELTQELSYAFSGNTKTDIELEGTTAWGEYGSALLGGLGGVGGFIATRAIGVAFPPIGIALAAVSLLGWIFSDSKEEKIRKAKKKLRDDLTEPSFDMLNKMDAQIVDILNKEILNNGIDAFADMLVEYSHMLARLGKSQYKTARALFRAFNTLNTKLLGVAIEYKGAGFISSVEQIARVPGETMIVFAARSNLNTAELSNLLGEKLLVMPMAERLPDTVRKILGCDVKHEFYPLDYDTDDKQAERAVAVFPKKKVNVTAWKIAQQIAGVPIVADVSAPNNHSVSF